jgi:hypothetical protein
VDLEQSNWLNVFWESIVVWSQLINTGIKTRTQRMISLVILAKEETHLQTVNLINMANKVNAEVDTKDITTEVRGVNHVLITTEVTMVIIISIKISLTHLTTKGKTHINKGNLLTKKEIKRKVGVNSNQVIILAIIKLVNTNNIKAISINHSLRAETMVSNISSRTFSNKMLLSLINKTQWLGLLLPNRGNLIKITTHLTRTQFCKNQTTGSKTLKNDIY